MKRPSISLTRPTLTSLPALVGLVTLISLAALVGLPTLAWAPSNDQAARVLNRFFQASGGLEQLQNLQSVSVNAGIEAYDYQYTMHLLADGRFRIEAPDRTTVYDGRDYWQSFHGVVQELTGDALDDYREISLGEVFFHGFLDAEGNAARLEYVDRETARGLTYELLAGTSPDGDKRTFYLNTATGLLDKIVELTPDPDLRELKNIYTFTDYQDVGGLVLPTTFQALCITNGESVQPLTQFTDFKLNERPDEGLFIKPESTAPAASLINGALSAQVVSLSGRGSLITNITTDDLAKLGASDGAILVAELRGHEIHLAYMAEIQGATEIRSGDYLATFNRTPTLWLVKAYLGMTSDDSTYAAGDKIRLTVSAETAGEAGK